MEKRGMNFGKNFFAALFFFKNKLFGYSSKTGKTLYLESFIYCVELRGLRDIVIYCFIV
jgi:hypothetical protein